ncbi:hypothetical protein [Anaerovorax odorimutans]|uniref:hypothetical protein n=1 Tax=Anaerovorax odorimutans TaxID=109327 RepID=UPI000419B8A6|nr:hypothetical protein [Anaerovorax odorimutans]
MKNIIILYDLIAREYWSCNELMKILKDQGYSVYLFQWNFEYYKALSVAKNNLIDLLIIPSCYTGADYQRVVMPFKNLNMNTTILCMHNEQIGYVGLKDDYLIPNEDLCKNTMYHLAWGEYFKQNLIDHGVSEDFIIKTGSIRLQEGYIKAEKVNREELARKYNLDPDKKWLLYCDSGGALFYDMKQKGQKATTLIGGTTELNEMVKPYADTYVKSVEILGDFIDKHKEDFEIIFRLHPGVKDFDSSQFNSKIKIIRDYSVYTWFQHVEANIVSYSTSIFESDAMGIKSFVLKPVYFKYEVVGVCEYSTCQTVEDIEDILIDKKEVVKGLYKDYIGEIKNNTVESLVYEINSILAMSKNKTQFINCNVNNKKKYSSIIANIAFYTFYRLGIIKYIKWPFSFDMNKYEHPIYHKKYI